MNWERIPVASYVFFGLFLLFGIVHLVFCFLEMERMRKISKCFPTLFLAIAATIAVPTSPLVYVGAFLGVLGDLFLIKKHKVWPFVLGMLSFLGNHACYIVAYMLLCQPLHWAFYLVTALYCVLFPIAFYRVGRKIIHQRHIAFGGVGYFGFLLLDLIWAIIATSMGNALYCFLAVIGAAVFIASDIILARTLFKKDTKRRDFYIMITYLLGQGLIVLGLTFTILMR